MMRRGSWLMVTVVTVVATFLVLIRAGHLGVARAARPAPRRVELHGTSIAADPATGAAAVRWRSAQPTHWRACLLQR